MALKDTLHIPSGEDIMSFTIMPYLAISKSLVGIANSTRRVINRNVTEVISSIELSRYFSFVEKKRKKIMFALSFIRVVFYITFVLNSRLVDISEFDSIGSFCCWAIASPFIYFTSVLCELWTSLFLCTKELLKITTRWFIYSIGWNELFEKFINKLSSKHLVITLEGRCLQEVILDDSNGLSPKVKQPTGSILTSLVGLPDQTVSEIVRITIHRGHEQLNFISIKLLQLSTSSSSFEQRSI